MLSTITTVTKAAAPHLGSAVVNGAQALAGFAVSTKVGMWAKGKGFSALVDLDESVGAAKAAKAERKVQWDNITQFEEQSA